jgi:hypothetical protein
MRDDLRSRLLASDTELGRFMAAHSLSPVDFAELAGVAVFTAYKLCGLRPPKAYGAASRPTVRLDSEVLGKVSGFTGISVGTLAEDAVRATKIEGLRRTRAWRRKVADDAVLAE